MLVELDIRDLAIAEHVRAAFEPGLNVITGETGAGKSVIIDALALLLGGRADAGMVRAGAAAARLQGVFQLDPDVLPAELQQALQSAGAEPEEGVLVIGRDVAAAGRGLARINGRVSVLSSLGAIGERLVDIHGQTDHTALLQPAQHIRFLDRFGNLGDLRARVAEPVRRLRSLRVEIERLRGNERERVRQQERLAYECDEIARAELRAGEEEELRAERSLLENAVQLADLADAGYVALRGGTRSAGAVDALGKAAETLQQLAALDPRLGETATAAAALQEQASDLARELRAYREGVEHNPARLTAVEDRLSLILQLERKYGASLAEVIAYGEDAARRLTELVSSEETAARLQAEEAHLLHEIGRHAGELSRARTEAAARLIAAVEGELRDLKLEHARVGVAFSRRRHEQGVTANVPSQEVVGGTNLFSGTPSAERPGGPYACDASGIDRVEFLVSLNPGEPLRPLARVASGGETSRLLLALKSVLGEADAVPILVFDEIEAGLGGRTGGVVGEKLARLATHHQVICITHLPQIAALATHHLTVVKGERDGRATVTVERLEGEARVAELAAMLGGATAANQRSARELLAASSSHGRALRAM